MFLKILSFIHFQITQIVACQISQPPFVILYMQLLHSNNLYAQANLE